MAAAVLLPNVGRGGRDEDWLPLGPRIGGQHSPCVSTIRARGWGTYRALSGQRGCEKKFSGSRDRGLALLGQKDRGAVTHRAIKGEHAERVSVN